MTKILILGGIREATALALRLVREGHNITTSLAGRTKDPSPIKGNVRTGGFGGAEGLAKYLTENNVELLIDYTHPFAKQISLNAIEAAKLTGIKLETHTRPPWQKQEGDHWLEVATLVEARDYIPSHARVFLTLGSQHIDLFKTRTDVFFLVRMVDQPEAPLSLLNHKLLIGKPSPDWLQEKALLEEHKITHIVCRDSGGKGAYAKIEAAHKLGLYVIMISR